jgi:hypothetical protein
MFKTFYDKTSGEILSCRRMSEEQVQTILANNPNWGVLYKAVDGIGKNRVNLQTMKIELIPVPQPTVADLIRERRIFLLQGSDWTQGADSPLTPEKKAEWAAYRQALRDLPDEQGGVNSFADVVWPAQP